MVTKEGSRQGIFNPAFSINRCHQRMVTRKRRRNHGSSHKPFPINRCHQRVVTTVLSGLGALGVGVFPINRCHQRVVTSVKPSMEVKEVRPRFPINRCHQRVVSHISRHSTMLWDMVWEFPINRCHQRVVTAAPERACAASDPRTVCAPTYLGRC